LKKDGKIKYVKIHRLFRYDPQDLLAYIEQQRKFSNYEIRNCNHIVVGLKSYGQHFTLLQQQKNDLIYRS